MQTERTFPRFTLVTPVVGETMQFRCNVVGAAPVKALIAVGVECDQHREIVADVKKMSVEGDDAPYAEVFFKPGTTADQKFAFAIVLVANTKKVDELEFVDYKNSPANAMAVSGQGSRHWDDI